MDKRAPIICFFSSTNITLRTHMPSQTYRSTYDLMGEEWLFCTLGRRIYITYFWNASLNTNNVGNKIVIWWAWTGGWSGVINCLIRIWNHTRFNPLISILDTRGSAYLLSTHCFPNDNGRIKLLAKLSHSRVQTIINRIRPDIEVKIPQHSTLGQYRIAVVGITIVYCDAYLFCASRRRLC